MKINKTYVVALLSGLASSLCCIGPAAVLALGVGSAGAATVIKGLTPLRPLFILLSITFLGLAWRTVYGKRACALTPHVLRQRRVALWTVMAVVGALISLPYVLAQL